ncbi:MAG: hypothetical protein SFT93_05505 [Rickettsiaceae bacterium]|nr:hypothetical protein [Rickettsiaceae bacterium]
MVTFLCSLTLVCVYAIVQVNIHLYNLSRKINEKNIQTIDLFLEKKFIFKLLMVFLDKNHGSITDAVTREVINYYSIECLMIKLDGIDKVFTFQGNIGPETVSIEKLKYILGTSYRENNNDGIIQHPETNSRQIISFKKDGCVMLIVVEPKHKLSKFEKSSLGHEVITIVSHLLLNFSNIPTNPKGSY